jgi:hypothetical protein
VPLLTALALLVMAAGLWFSGSAATVAAPRLQSAEARIAAATTEQPRRAAPAPAEQPEPAAAPPAAPEVAPVTAPVAGATRTGPAAVALPVGGPRAPPLR